MGCKLDIEETIMKAKVLHTFHLGIAGMELLCTGFSCKP